MYCGSDHHDIEASDGEIGHVEEFIVDDEAWTICYIIVDTPNWWPGKNVLVSPQWIRGVSWTDQRVRVDLSRDTIKNAPEYDEHARPNREYERRLHEHHGQPHYWGG